MSDLETVTADLARTLGWRLEEQLRVLASEKLLDLAVDARRDVQAALEDVGRVALLSALGHDPKVVETEAALVRATLGNWAWVAADAARSWIRETVAIVAEAVKVAAPALAKALLAVLGAL